MRTLITALCLLLTLLFFAVPAEYGCAAVPSTLNYQGMLSDNAGQPITGPHDITFSLYRDGSTRFWQETQNVTFDGSGRFSVTLGSGSGNPLDPKNFTGTTFIGIQVGTEPELAPRQQLTSVAYAFQSFLGGVPSGVIVMWSGATNVIPEGWALCDGTQGTPNLRGRFIVGAGGSYSVGNTGGKASHVLTTNEMPSHTHVQNAHTHTQNSHNHGGWTATQQLSRNYAGGSGQLDSRSSDNGYGLNTSRNEGLHKHVINSDTATNKNTTATNKNTGGGAAHENRPPYYALAYIMKL